MLDRHHTLLIVVDVQERMMPAIAGGAAIVENVVRLVKGCSLLGIPMLVSEQYPKGLGTTLPEVREALGEWYRPIEKMSFSAMGDLTFRGELEIAARENIIVCGAETHVCVYQTARDLRNMGHTVEIVADAVGSRTESNKQIALEHMRGLGITQTSVEMALFEIMDRADIPEFKAVQALVK